MEYAETIDEREGFRRERGMSKVRLHEIHGRARARDLDGVAHIHPNDLGLFLVCEVEPATHSAACIQRLEAWPADRLRALEVPLEDPLVDSMQFGEPRPFVTEGALCAQRIAVELCNGDRDELGVVGKEIRMLGEQRNG